MTAAMAVPAVRPVALRGRFSGRVAVVARGLADRVRPRREPDDPRRILVAHHLLLGDTLMLTPLLAKLRERYPGAHVAMTVAEAAAPLYATRPYGVHALPWNPAALPPALFREAPFDLALVPGDNRYAWLAAAMRARWIVAFGGAPSLRRDFAVDRFVEYRATPAAWGDLCTDLVAGPPPAAYQRIHWPTPAAAPFARPAGPYAIVHVGASSPLKRWPAARSAAIVAMLQARGLAPVLTAGRGEEGALRAANPQRRHAEFAGTLDLAQLWHLVEGARVLVAPDTGVAHLGRVVGTPTVAIFGPGSATICGAGDFWREARYRAVTVDPFPCRDQRVLFRREVEWVRRCARTTAQCAHARCLDAIGDDAIAAALDDVLR
jgi:ADP-heptose:LPS heptosyltransferase